MYWLSLAVLGLCAASTEAAGPSRWTGRIHSIAPEAGVVFVEDGGDESDDVVSVRYRDAKVVHVWRDPEQRAEWRERFTRLSRWPAGTFLVIIGSVEPSGMVRAYRIEIPQADAP